MEQRTMGELHLIEVGGGEDLEQIRELFQEYARALPFDLCFQNFDRELAELPGRYARPTGCILLAHVAQPRGEGILPLCVAGILPAIRGRDALNTKNKGGTPSPRAGVLPVGCVALRQIGEGICEMKRLYVRPAFRGRGIGRALATTILEEARRIGYKRIRLDTVLEPAKRLYRSLGFREIPHYQHVPIKGVVFMELEL